MVPIIRSLHSLKSDIPSLSNLSSPVERTDIKISVMLSGSSATSSMKRISLSADESTPFSKCVLPVFIVFSMSMEPVNLSSDMFSGSFTIFLSVMSPNDSQITDFALPP